MKSNTKFIFKNWAGNESCKPANYYQPQTEGELIEIVKSNLKIRITGSGHSWNKICVTDAAMINLDFYNQVIKLDKEKQQIQVQAGIKLRQLNEYLDKHGFALRNLGSISKQSLAGAVSTATHGTGLQYCILASQVESFTLIKADGSKVLLHQKNDEQLFNLALVNLGCLGIISEITLNVVPAFNLHDKTYVANFDDVINNLHHFVSETDHFKLWWFPHIDEVVVYQYTRTSEAANDSRFRQWLMDEVLSVTFYRLFLKIGTLNRNWRKNINGALVRNFIGPLDRIEKSYKVFNVPEPPIHRESEWAFDLNNAQALLRDYKHMINASKHRINFLQEIRFSKGDDYALSPAFGRDSVWLGVYNADNFGWDELMQDFEILAHQYNGRPHWGKEFKGVNSSFLRSVYPQYQAFIDLKNGMDPTGKFENEFIKSLFG